MSVNGLFIYFHFCIYLCLAALGLFMAALAFLLWLSVAAESGSYSLVVIDILIAVASPGHVGFSSCSSQALEPRLGSCGAWA